MLGNHGLRNTRVWMWMFDNTAHLFTFFVLEKNSYGKQDQLAQIFLFRDILIDGQRLLYDPNQDLSTF